MDREPSYSPIGEAMAWVSRIMAIGFTMFLPGVAGSWLDARFGTTLLAPAGLVIGFAIAIFALTRLRGGGDRRSP